MINMKCTKTKIISEVFNLSFTKSAIFRKVYVSKDNVYVVVRGYSRECDEYFYDYLCHSIEVYDVLCINHFNEICTQNSFSIECVQLENMEKTYYITNFKASYNYTCLNMNDNSVMKKINIVQKHDDKKLIQIEDKDMYLMFKIDSFIFSMRNTFVHSCSGNFTFIRTLYDVVNLKAETFSTIDEKHFYQFIKQFDELKDVRWLMRIMNKAINKFTNDEKRKFIGMLGHQSERIFDKVIESEDKTQYANIAYMKSYKGKYSGYFVFNSPEDHKEMRTIFDQKMRYNFTHILKDNSYLKYELNNHNGYAYLLKGARISDIHELNNTLFIFKHTKFGDKYVKHHDNDEGSEMFKEFTKIFNMSNKLMK